MPTYTAGEHTFELPVKSNTYQTGKYVSGSTVREQGYPVFTIVDRATFNRLKEAGVSNQALIKLSSYNKLTNVSDLTQAYLLLLNNVFYRWYHGYEVFSTNAEGTLSPTELTYVKDLVKTTLTDPSSTLEEGKTSYEIQLADDQGALVIVENGFLHHLTQSKDSCKAFVLALLRCFDHFGSTSVGLNAFYLKLVMNPNFFQVVRVRAGL